MAGTEDSIFESITSATGDNFEGSGADVSTEQNTAVPGQQQQVDPSGQPVQQQAPAHRVPNQQQQRTPQQQNGRPNGQQVQPTPEGLHRDRAGRIVDKAGNIYDDNGQLLARTGSHRNHYEQLQRNKQLNAELQKEVLRLQQQASRLDPQAINGLPTKYGITDPKEMEDAFRVAQMFKRDPAGAVRQMISFVVSKGIDLQQIVGGQGIPQIQTEAMRRMLDERLGPITERQKQEQATQEAIRQGELMSQQFLTEHPEAVPHANDLGALINEIGTKAKQEGRQVTVQEAALTALNQLRTFCEQNGLDFKRSIPDQVAELRERQGAAPTGGRPNAPQSRRQVPMPQGGRSAGGVPVTDNRSRDLPLSANNGDIVKAAMREAGIEI